MSDSALEFVAIENSVEGVIPITNPSKSALTIGRINIDGISLKDEEGNPIRQLENQLELQPGETRNVPFDISLDPITPPGVYPGTFIAQEFQQKFVLHILESVSFEIYPEEIVFEAKPGEEITKTIMVNNEGNLPISLKGEMPFTLNQADEIKDMIQHVFGEMSPEEGFGKLADEVLSRLRNKMGPPIMVRIEGGGQKINPGSSKICRLSMHLPDSLKAGDAYAGTVCFYNQQKKIYIVVKS